MHPLENLSPPVPPQSSYRPPSSDHSIFPVTAARLQDSHSAQQAASSSSQQPQPQYPIKIPPEKQAKALELYNILKLAEALAENAKTTERQDYVSSLSDYIRSEPQTRSEIQTITSSYDNASDHQIESHSSVSSNQLLPFDGKMVKQRRRKRLSPVARKKAALIRYLGSCWPCRSKRIPCPLDHHDIQFLESLRLSVKNSARGEELLPDKHGEQGLEMSDLELMASDTVLSHKYDMYPPLSAASSLDFSQVDQHGYADSYLSGVGGRYFKDFGTALESNKMPTIGSHPNETSVPYSGTPHLFQQIEEPELLQTKAQVDPSPSVLKLERKSPTSAQSHPGSTSSTIDPAISEHRDKNFMSTSNSNFDAKCVPFRNPVLAQLAQLQGASFGQQAPFIEQIGLSTVRTSTYSAKSTHSHIQNRVTSAQDAKISSNIGHKAPLTDSGYASIPNPFSTSNVLHSSEQSQLPANAELLTAMNEKDREDVRTIYSAATTIGSACAQTYISELCTDIYNEIGPILDANFWNPLPDALPWIIKAFAINISYESTAKVNQDIMYFIHKRHKDIIKQLEAMFRHADDEESSAHRDGSGGMSLHDKITMWETKTAEDDLVFESEDLYQGVKDDVEEIIDGVGLHLYRNTIFTSTAYKWLLANLRRENRLQWSATQPRVMTESIRSKIMSMLPAGMISKRRGPTVYEVKFDFPWGNGIKSQDGDELNDRLEVPICSFGEFMTLTGSLEEAQLLTITDYMSQTWPRSGTQLLDILHDAVHCHGHQDSVYLQDNAHIETRLSDLNLAVTATGPAHFIAECGEQLAWLRCALLSSGPSSIVPCTPSITVDQIDCVSLTHEKSNYKGHCSIGYDISLLANRDEIIARSHNFWQRPTEKCVLVLGYPISRRPEGFPGLELSFHVLLNILQAKNAILTGGHIVLEGRERNLRLVKHDGEIFLWHPFEGRPCSCFKDCVTEINGVKVPPGPIFSKILDPGRHILNGCKDPQNNKTASRISENAALSGVVNAQQHAMDKSDVGISSINLCRNQHATNLNGNLSSLTPHENDTSFSRPSNTCELIDPVPEDLPLSFSTEHQWKHSSSDDQDMSLAKSQSIATVGSSGDSLDSDLLSISDYSEQIDPLHINEPMFSSLNTLLQRLLAGFRSTVQCQLSPNRGGESFVRQKSSSSSSNATGTSNKCLKRGRDQDDDDDADKDGLPKRPRKKINPGTGKALQRSLACLYLKFDPMKYHRCCTKQLSRIRDVKQHLSRRHTPEWYCQRCLETNFMDEQSLDRHISLNTCLLKERALLEGLSHQQQRQMSRKSKPGLNEEEQWFAIWEIIFPTSQFPGLRRPSSAYMDAGLSREMGLFREYCSIHGPNALTEQIESDPAWSGSEITAEQRRVYLDRVIAQGINSLFEAFINSEIFSNTASPSTQSLNNMQSAQNLAGSIADSGVALESQLSPWETAYRESELDQSPVPEELSDQLPIANDLVQGDSTTQEIALEALPNHGDDMQNMSLPDTSFDFLQFEGSGPSTFDSFEPFKDF